MTNLEETSGPAAGPEGAQRWLPALLLLFVGSGCAALIYEVVWFQLLQLSIGSSAVSLGVLLGIYHGRHVPGQPAAAAVPQSRCGTRSGSTPRSSSASGCSASSCCSRCRSSARSTPNCRYRPGQSDPARHRRRHLSAAADAADGRDAAGDRALGRNDAARRVVARLLLRRQPGRRRRRQPAGRLLPAARVRHADGHGRCGRAECRRGRTRRPGCDAHAAHGHYGRRSHSASRSRCQRKARGSSTSRSRCRG